MRYVGTSKVAAASLFLLAVTACSDTTEPGATVDIPAREVLTTIETLVLPVRASQPADTSLSEAASVLVAQGAVLDRAPAASALAAELGIDLIGSVASVELPPDLLGKTIVYDATTEQWVVSPDRTDAPADAVRVIWYRRTGGFLVFPLVEDGYVDLTDRDDGGELSKLGIRIVATVQAVDAEDIVLADFTRGSRITDDGVENTEHIEASGFYRAPGFDNDVDFDLTSTVVQNSDTGIQESSLDLALSAPAAGLSYTTAFTSTESGGTVTDGSFHITVTQSGATTVLDLVTPGTGGADFTGTLAHGGSMQANVTYDNSRFLFTTPQGERIASGQASNLSIVVQAMLVGWFEVVTYLPFFIV